MFEGRQCVMGTAREDGGEGKGGREGGGEGRGGVACRNVTICLSVIEVSLHMADVRDSS